VAAEINEPRYAAINRAEVRRYRRSRANGSKANQDRFRTSCSGKVLCKVYVGISAPVTSNSHAPKGNQGS